MQNKSKKKSQFSIVMKRLFRNKGAVIGMIIIVLLILVAIFAKKITVYDYFHQDYAAAYQHPNSEHIFGTDNYGRDIFARVAFGTRYSLTIGVCSVLLASLIGGILGAIAGYYGGNVDNFIMRFLDIYQSVPPLVLCLAMAAVFGNGVFTTILAIGISSMAGFARLLRSSILQVKGNEYIEAARAIKGSDLHIIIKHIIPNAFAPMIVAMSMGIGSSIITTATLGFVGLGIPSGIPEWGAMLSASRGFMRDYSYMLFAPGITMIITVLAFNLFGDGLRDALDPKLKD